jgi:UPF0755 protein
METNESHISRHTLPSTRFLGVLGAVFIAIALIVTVSAPARFPKGGILTIAPGGNLRTVADSLVAGGYVRSRFLFVTLVTIMGGERSITPGDYYFPKPKSVFRIAEQIAKSNHGLDPVKITIPEGRNVREIAAILSDKLPGFPEESFLLQARQYEGYLFPDTYFVYPKTDPMTVIADMRAMFKKKTESILKEKNGTQYSVADIVIIASLIEREARGDDDRAMISGVIFNRLEKGMPLQLDASVAFANSIPDNQLKKSHFSVDSPYNTYIYRKLPPGPIANPGIKSISAALNPAKTDYLYYLHDKHGTIHYAKTYPEHQKNISRYLRQ